LLYIFSLFGLAGYLIASKRCTISIDHHPDQFGKRNAWAPPQFGHCLGGVAP
jgi:hypothetical protein